MDNIGSAGVAAQDTPSQPLKRGVSMAGSPNVLLVVLDDVGFGQLGCYGSRIATPNLDSLAQNGLLYTSFHTTGLCSPTRSCLLTGRNHHANGMGCVTNFASDALGYNSLIPKQNGFISEILQQRGYSTLAVGKWHLTPDDEMTVSSLRSWPLQRGFDRYYGFLAGAANHWQPGSLVYDNHFLNQAMIDEGYHLTEDLTDHAIEFLVDNACAAEEKPFFLYLAYGAGHSPHHVEQSYIDSYRGMFDEGWDVERERVFARQKELGIFTDDVLLPPRNPRVPAWDSLEPAERHLYARMQEVFAGFLTHADQQFGRVLKCLQSIGQSDNTLVIALSDNGASAEGGRHGSVNEFRLYNGIPDTVEENIELLSDLGGPAAWNNYPEGWSMAGNTPFRMWKRYTYQGGIADPLIVNWPNVINTKFGIRKQYHHAIDIVPTILEALNVDAPELIKGVSQSPLHGTSFCYSWENIDSESPKEVQYYEMLGTRALWYRGWKAVTTHEPLSGRGRFNEDVWELYHLASDPTETCNVANEYPEILEKLISRWWVEAGKYGVLPLDDRGWERISQPTPSAIASERLCRVFYPGMSPLLGRGSVDLTNRSFSITADIVIGSAPPEGVILAQGSRFGGFSFFIKSGEIIYLQNLAGVKQTEIRARIPSNSETLSVVFTFNATDFYSGMGSISVNGTSLAELELSATPRAFPFNCGLTCGRDDTGVTQIYNVPFHFAGGLERVTVSLGDRFDHLGRSIVAATMGEQ